MRSRIVLLAVAAAAAAATNALAGKLARAASAGDSIQLQAGAQLSSAPWKTLSSVRSVKLDAAVFTRGFLLTPNALAFTITASRPKAVRLFWSVYCEGYENDVIFNQQGTVTMRAPYSGYPTLMQDPAKCVLTLRTAPTNGTKVQAKTFGY